MQLPAPPKHHQSLRREEHGVGADDSRGCSGSEPGQLGSREDADNGRGEQHPARQSKILQMLQRVESGVPGMHDVSFILPPCADS
jgi:hypothetical protein